MLIYIEKKIPNQPPEKEYGNKEYKRYLINHPKNNQEKFIEKRATQMLFRIIEGNGKAVYLFGVEDDGKIKEMDENQLQTTIFYLKKIASSIKALIKKIRIYKSKNGFVCSARIQLSEEIFSSIIDSINSY